MEFEPLKVLLVGNDARFAHGVAEMLRASGGVTEVATAPTLEAGLAELAAHSYHAILFELPSANAAGLFQVTQLTTKIPRLPVVVFGPADDGIFGAEIIRTGAQDYLTKDEIDPRALQHALRCAIERQHEYNALIDEKDNYYGVFDHLVEGVFRTTPDGHYLLANVALARIYGYDSPVELMASIHDIAHRLYVEPGRREEFVRLMQEHDTLSGFESQIYRKDGTIIWISENCRAVRDAQGQVALLRRHGRGHHATAANGAGICRIRNPFTIRWWRRCRKTFSGRTCWGGSPLPTSNTAGIIIASWRTSSAKRILTFSRRNWRKNIKGTTSG